MLCLTDIYGYHFFKSMEEAQLYFILRDFPGIRGEVVVTDKGITVRTTADRPTVSLDTKKRKAIGQSNGSNCTDSDTTCLQ